MCVSCRLKIIKMKKYILSLLAVCLCTLAIAQPPAGNAKTGDMYGDASSVKTVKSANQNLDNLSGEEALTGNFEGVVTDVCPKKGCWIKLQLKDGKTATVKMKDYGFFVPTALKGKKIVINGNAELKTTSVKELQHLAEDAGKSKEEIDAITEPKETITIMANGIKVVKS